MMDIGKKAWVEIINRIYPDLPVIRDKDTWLTGQFKRPSVFIETDLVSEKVHTPQSVRVIEDVGLVFHYDYEKEKEEDKGEPIPFDLSPFFLYLRQERYCVGPQKHGIMLVVDPPRTREKSDQIEIICRYSYLLHIPKHTTTPGGKEIQKINHFCVEGVDE
ncbi:hypothetical protein [Aneurinibacillus thermoaerophilus]|uniref:Uncharacterized protein n=1 Tax=Aneurinibacillus thermoaerophilus TaxID=143495 RepID=A0ABX8YCN7_ANETH|nr:hypothetical protein [Aneurinibacillus thermoaerophilus]MED0675867.1 hypothetical protein [Aneurinibacillus thermoaerophilus]MED0737225.1 hypothetical protein [Aneurinibacillus thermoaerophilus]QYY43392.1 hypothetical protein K3F53_03830 [Aneurinibacillus thermoaerophilus]